MKGRFLVTGILAVTISAGAALRAGPPGLKPRPAPEAHESVYRPTLAVPESMRPFLEHLEPGSDAFALERTARELDARLRLLADALHAGAAGTVATELLDPAFHGARLLPVAAAHTAAGPPDVARATDLPRDLTIDAHAFGAELQRLRADMRDVIVAEFLITAIESDGRPDVPSVRTTVRYDIVGAGTSAFRVEHVGEWELRWRRAAAEWRVVEWRATSDVTSRARVPIFAEITTAALGGIDSFHKQLSIDLDAWMATFDSVLTRDSNGHHGVSVGDVDGDGLDDLYIAQPAGLPNRLYRNRGDSTFEDVTEQAGVGVLDDTAQSLFADVDNDGDQDLILTTAVQPLLFLNDGRSRSFADGRLRPAGGLSRPGGFAPPEAFLIRGASPRRTPCTRARGGPSVPLRARDSLARAGA